MAVSECRPGSVESVGFPCPVNCFFFGFFLRDTFCPSNKCSVILYPNDCIAYNTVDSNFTSTESPATIPPIFVVRQVLRPGRLIRDVPAGGGRGGQGPTAGISESGALGRGVRWFLAAATAGLSDRQRRTRKLRPSSASEQSPGLGKVKDFDDP
jgi:hypothetical protein